MERRTFILGLFALSTGSAGVALAGKAEAAPAVSGSDALAKAEGATLPGGEQIEQAQYRRRRRRQVCTVRRNRFGRPVRVCRWVWY